MLTLIRGGLLNLRLFDGGEASGTGGSGQAAAATAPAVPDIQPPGPKNPLADVQYGKQAESKADKQSGKAAQTDAQDREAQFEAYIRDNKDLYDKRVESVVKDRFKHVKGLEAQLKGHSEIASVLAMKYGLDPADVKGLANAVKSDDTLFESVMDELGMPDIDTTKQVLEARQYRAEAQRIAREREMNAEMDRLEQGWRQDAALVKQQYFPNMDFEAELNHPETGNQFRALLQSGVDVKTAYIALHNDEVMPGVMQHTAQTIQQKTTNDVRARGMRPVENGASAQAAATVKSSVDKFTRKDIDEITRRVARGDKIIL